LKHESAEAAAFKKPSREGGGSGASRQAQSSKKPKQHHPDEASLAEQEQALIEFWSAVWLPEVSGPYAMVEKLCPVPLFDEVALTRNRSHLLTTTPASVQITCALTDPNATVAAAAATFW